MIYIASPFFCRYDTAVMNRMITAAKSTFEDEVFLPNSTDASHKYDQHPTLEIAREIFKENVSHLDKADMIVFPEYTNDLGTLFEVGYALGKHIKVARYNYLNGTFTVVNDTEALQELANKWGPETPNYPQLIISCVNASSAVAVGYLYAHRFDVGYSLPEGKDNIMLAMAFNRYKVNIKEDEVIENGAIHGSYEDVEISVEEVQ